MITSKIIAHSIANGVPLITIQTKAPKFLDAEFEKHRMISSNSSSDRAIPLLKMLDKGYFLPDDIRLDQPGMQGDLLLDDDSKEAFWNDLKDLYGYTSAVLQKWDRVHKQHLNRYLMGFSWQNKIASATEFDNFFNLRLDKAADPAMYELARCMKEAMEASTPVELKPGEWHTPYGIGETVEERKLTSAAGCARVSYNNHDGSNRTVAKDYKLHNNLLEAGHMSPFEHQATPMPYCRDTLSSVPQIDAWVKGITHIDRYRNLWSSNFRGWIQYRQTL